MDLKVLISKSNQTTNHKHNKWKIEEDIMLN